MAASVKVHFRVQQDEDGFPPVSVESVWASPGSTRNEYVIDNVPFFARDATIGDTVLIREIDHELWFDKITHRSGNSLLRVVFFDPDALDRVNGQLRSMGCSTEYLRAHKLLAVNIPSDVKLTDVVGYLQSEAGNGTVDYEEPILRQ